MKSLSNFMVLLFTLIFTACNISDEQLKLEVDYVDPFIGTGGHGHTFPGATLPGGMVQLSPDCGTSGWDWCSGYHNSDNTIEGFSHLHLSGTGASDLGDILFMPCTGEIKWHPGPKDKPDEGYRSRFTHKSEVAKPGYYKVDLLDYNIKAELTATERTGIHRYTFPEKEQKHLLIDLAHGIHDGVVEGSIQIIDQSTIVGLRRSNGWANNQHVYFAAHFSKPIVKSQFYTDENIVNKEHKVNGHIVKALLEFDEKDAKELLVKVGISSVSEEGALNNIMKEAKHWDFNAYRNAAKKKWQQVLSKIEVSGKERDKTIFYTSLYHANIAPNVLSDADGKYRGMDNKIYEAHGFKRYHVFSLWDTFRANHPLYTITNPDRINDFMVTFISMRKEWGHLPVWELWGRENYCMIGYHSVPVILDAWKKGLVKTLPEEALLEAMMNSANADDRGKKYLREYKYIPADLENESVSKTLEYAYDDWCIAEMAKDLGKDSIYQVFSERASYYKNLWDAETKFMRGKLANGEWKPGFDPLFSKHRDDEYTEGNAWQYSWFVPHDIKGLVELHGGVDNFVCKLDSLFYLKTEVKGEHSSPDISGLIGQYAHGNEPSHHIAYLYNCVGKPNRTAKVVRQVLNNLYTDKIDGICGNEDCGQMSAWYVFSSMGFYPVNPADGKYVFGSPLFDKVKINISKSRSFTIVVENNNDENIYIQKTVLNGVEIKQNHITHQDIINGGTLEIIMGNTPISN